MILFSSRLLIISGGTLAITAAAVAMLRSDTSSAPGRIDVPVKSQIWQSPGDEPGGALPNGVRFELRNGGGRPVRLYPLKPQCACIEQSLSSDRVLPGGSVVLMVRPKPLRFGTQSLSIGIETDSPLTPLVELAIQVQGAEHSPFLHSIAGNLIFEGVGTGEERLLAISTVESPADPPRIPQPRSDLDFLEFVLRDTSTPRGDDSGPSVVERTFAVRIASSPPDESFYGDVIVDDPWNPGLAKSLPVRGQSVPALRIVPRRLVFRPDDEETKSFMVLDRTPGERSRFRVMPLGEQNPFRVDPAGSESDNSQAAFRLGWRPGAERRPGTYHVLVSAPSTGDETDLAILVREREP